MFESNRFETDTCQELLDRLQLMDLEVEVPPSACPDEIYGLIEQPISLFLSEGPWPFSPRPGNWAS
jgi:hypothetical protein